jgi:hypothetical protein
MQAEKEREVGSEGDKKSYYQKAETIINYYY